MNIKDILFFAAMFVLIVTAGYVGGLREAAQLVGEVTP